MAVANEPRHSVLKDAVQGIFTEIRRDLTNPRLIEATDVLQAYVEGLMEEARVLQDNIAIWQEHTP